MEKWYYNGSGLLWEILDIDTDELIADTYSERITKLLCAAPEMLELLHNAQEYICEKECLAPLGYEHEPICDKIRKFFDNLDIYEG